MQSLAMVTQGVIGNLNIVKYMTVHAVFIGNLSVLFPSNSNKTKKIDS